MSVYDYLYYKEFTGGTRNFRLEMLLGHNTNYGGVLEQEFPDDFILNREYELDSRFDNDLPFGMQLSDSLKIELELISISSGTFAGLNWLDVKTAITQEPQFSVDLGHTFIIPNLWRIKEDTNGDSTYDKIIFEGSQSFDQPNKTKYKYVNSTKTSEIINIEVLDIYRYAMQSINFDVLGLVLRAGASEITALGYGNHLVDLEYPIVGTGYIRSRFNKKANVNVLLFESIEAGLAIVLRTHLRALVRETISYTQSGSFLDPWIFYKQIVDGTALDSTKGALVANSALWSVISYTSSAGLVLDQESGFIAYESLHDYYKFMAENFFVKITFDYDTYTMNITKPLDSVLGAGETIAISDFIDLGDKEEPYEKIQMVRCFPDGIGSDDVGQTITSQTGILPQNKQDIDLKIHSNYTTDWNDTQITQVTPSTLERHGVLSIPSVKSNVLYYPQQFHVPSNVNLTKISDACTLDIGDGVTFSEETGYDADYPDWEETGDPKEFDALKPALTAWMAERNTKSGFGHVIGKAGLYLLGNSNQNMLPFTTTNDVISKEHLGDTGTYDMNTMQDASYYTNKVIFTGINESLISGEVVVNMFMRGQ